MPDAKPPFMIPHAKLTPFLWFEAEAVAFYLSVFKDGKIHTTTRYPEDGPRPAGSVMTIAFELQGQQFVAPRFWILASQLIPVCAALLYVNHV